MINNWNEIEKTYNSLNHTSRSAQNLSVWGEVFASAYKLNPDKASQMWQDIIELNTANNIEYARYFVGQIFKKIVDQLRATRATEFLLMNSSRQELLFLHGFDGGSHYECIYYVLGYFIVSEKHKEMFELMKLLARKYNTEDFANVSQVCGSLFSTLQKLSRNYTGYEDEFKKLSDEKIAEVYDLCIKTYPDTYLADMAYVRKCILLSTHITDKAKIQHYLEMLFEREQGLFADFLYLEHAYVSKEEITGYVERYVEKYGSLPLDYSDDDSPNEKRKAKWYQSFFSNSAKIRESLLLSPRGRVDDYEEKYLDSLIKNNEWRTWVRLLASMSISGDISRRYSVASYVTYRLSCAKAPTVHRDGIFTFSSYTSLDGDEVYCKFDDKKRIEFAKLVMVLIYLISGEDRTDDIARSVDEFIIANDSVKAYFRELGYRSSGNPQIIEKRISEYGERIVSANEDWKKELQFVFQLKQKIEDEKRAAEELRLRSMSSSEGLVNCFLSVSPYVPKKSVFLKEEMTYSHYLKILSGVVVHLQAHFKEKGSNILEFIGEKSGVRPIYMTDAEGKILRETNMIVSIADDNFCEYTLRYLEALMREKVNFSRVDYPEVPSAERPAAIYYSHPNGNKGYYRCKNENEQKCVLDLDKRIYVKVQNVVKVRVDAYFSKNPSALTQIDSLIVDKKVKKPIVEEISALIDSGSYSDDLLEKAFAMFQNTTATNKKTKGTLISNLLWNYWVHKSPLASQITYGRFAEIFSNLEWDTPYEVEILNRNYGAALPYFTRNYNIYKRLRASDINAMKNAIIVSLYAIDELCRRLNIDRTLIYLGKWQSSQWMKTNSNEKGKYSIKNFGDVQIYNPESFTFEQYVKSPAQSKLIRYILKSVEISFLQAKGLPGINVSLDDVEDLLPCTNYKTFVQFLPAVIYQATLFAAVNESPVILEKEPAPVVITEISERQYVPVSNQGVVTEVDCNQIAEAAYIYCFGERPKELTPLKEQYDCFCIDLENARYSDYFEAEYVSDELFVQEPNKQVLTRFHTLYDSYCEQLQRVFDIRYTYDPTFSVNSSKLMRKGEGFVGKDLYQFAQIEQDSRDFMQWIARIERGEIIFPRFQAYIPMLFYYFINEQLFADKKPIALVVLCKMWNHYYNEFSDQDASLLLAWIKDFWMVYCQEIPLADLKKLFNRKIVFINEPQYEVLDSNRQLEYYNDVCFYRVLHGKLVSSGYQDLFEATIGVVNTKLSKLWNSYGLSYRNMLYQASGKNTYLFLRAIVLKDNLYKISTLIHELRVSELENYNLVENEKTVRLQWEYTTQEYSAEFIKTFMEYTLKLTEYRLRCWLGLGVNNTFNVDANTIYKFKQHNEQVAKLLLDDMNESHIERIVYDSVVEVCNKLSVIQRGYFEPFSVVKTANGRIRDEILPEEEFMDYEGIDPTQRVTASSLEEARRVLHQNQDKLIVEDEIEETKIPVAEKEVSFDTDEISLLRVLLYSNDVSFDLQRMAMQNKLPTVLISRINEKAMDLYGDVLIDEETVPPSIYDDYIELCKGVIDSHE